MVIMAALVVMCRGSIGDNDDHFFNNNNKIV